jgi:hypothetical protein
MSFAYNKDLKIEFRAVPYSTSHVLEYRISPDQNLTYETEVSIFGLFKIKLKKKYKTNWHQPCTLVNYPGAERYSKESGEPYLPMFIRDKKELKDYQTKFKTCGEFFKYTDETEAKEEAAWQKARNEYLDNCGTWE